MFPLARDAAAIDAGLNPELIAFPRSSYNRVVFSAGFEFSIPLLHRLRQRKITKQTLRLIHLMDTY